MKPTKRKAFQFQRSYFDVLNKLNDDSDKLSFLLAVINKQFLDEEPKDLNFIVDLAYESQRHFIEKSVKGYKSVKKTDLQGNPTRVPAKGPAKGLTKGLTKGPTKGPASTLADKNKNKNKNNKEIYKEKIDFEKFWSLYDKKQGEDYSRGRWNDLDLETQKKIIAYIPKYKAAYPDSRYRKKPANFLIDETWNDELPEVKREFPDHAYYKNGKLKPREFWNRLT